MCETVVLKEFVLQKNGSHIAPRTKQRARRSSSSAPARTRPPARPRACLARAPELGATVTASSKEWIAHEALVSQLAARTERTPTHDSIYEPFDTSTAFSDFESLSPSFDWRACLAPQHDAGYDMSTLRAKEHRIRTSGSEFGARLDHELSRRANEPIRRGQYDLLEFLNILSHDPDPGTCARIYATMSRGLDLSQGQEVIPSDLPNYPSAEDEENTPHIQIELDRLLRLGFVCTWANFKRKFDVLAPLPRIISPIAVILKTKVNPHTGEESLKRRIVIDTSVTSDPEGRSINSLADVKGKTFFTTIAHATAGMHSKGYLWSSDISDCFLCSPLALSSVDLSAIRFQGTIYVYLRAGFGHACTPRMANNLCTLQARSLILKCRSLGLYTCTLPEFEKALPFNTPSKNGAHHVSHLGTILDDVLACCKSRRAAEFSFAHWIMQAYKLNTPLSEAKTEPPCKELLHLGFKLSLTSMTVSVDQSKVDRCLHDLSDTLNKKSLKRKELQSLIGLLSHLSTVVRGGRASYRFLLNALRCEGSPNPHDRICVTSNMRFDLHWWALLITHLPSGPVMCGVRRPMMSWSCYTDSSFTGWAYVSSNGAFHGKGTWPQAWLDNRIGRDTKFHDVWIVELELWTVLFLIRHIAKYVASCSLRVFIDCRPVCYMLRRHSSRSTRATRILAEIELTAVVYDIELIPLVISSHQNRAADIGSRTGSAEYSEVEWQRELALLKQASKQSLPDIARPMVRGDIEPLRKLREASLEQYAEDLKQPCEAELLAIRASFSASQAEKHAIDHATITSDKGDRKP